MATKEIKKDPTEYSVEEKLQSLYQLQSMLSEIDKIKTLRGELPLEVQDLEDEIAGLTTRIEKASADVVEMSKGVAENKNTIEVSRSQIAKYQEQQDHVSNNREFDSLNKEIFFSSFERLRHLKYTLSQISNRFLKTLTFSLTSLTLFCGFVFKFQNLLSDHFFFFFSLKPVTFILWANLHSQKIMLHGIKQQFFCRNTILLIHSEQEKRESRTHTCKYSPFHTECFL